jgi:hypothetical protein
MSSNNTYIISEQQYLNFKPTYLMIKQHEITGLKYLCKTIRLNPIKYKGSGTYWKSHIKKHGKQLVNTIWCKYFTNIESLVFTALTLSEIYNIVESNEWANLKLENGLDGIDSKTAKLTAKKRIKNGTHHFLLNNPVYTQIINKTHAFLGGEVQRESNKIRLENGTHHFLLNNPSKNSVENGTHHFLGGDIQRKTSKIRLENGTHNFLNNGKIQTELNCKNAQRPIYIELKRLYKLKGLSIPRGTFMKTDSDILEMLNKLTSSINVIEFND